MEAHLKRQCGGCTKCCALIPVLRLDKGANCRCVHQTDTGCGIFGDKQRPKECRGWRCRWLRGDPVGDRPDRAGYVVDDLPLFPMIQVWVDPERPQAWLNRDLLRYFHSKMAKHAIVLRYGVPGPVRQLTNGEVLCWLEHSGDIDDASWPELREQSNG